MNDELKGNLRDERQATRYSSFITPHSSFHCGGHGMTLPRGVGVGAGGGADGRVVCASLVRALRSGSDARGLLSAESSRPVCAGVGVPWAGESALFFGRDGSALTGTPLSERTVGSFGAFVRAELGGL